MADVHHDLEWRARELRAAMRAAANEFYRHKSELADLRASFWSAVLNLSLVEDTLPIDELPLMVLANCRALGAPGDFGYGTPCGEALKALYEAHRRLVAERQRMAAATA